MFHITPKFTGGALFSRRPVERLVGPGRLRDPATSLGIGLLEALDAEALKSRNPPGDGTLRFPPDGGTGLAAWQGLNMAAFISAFVEADGLSGSC